MEEATRANPKRSNAPVTPKVSAGASAVRGRGTRTNPPNRFERHHYVPIPIEIERSREDGPKTQLLRDRTRSIITRNQSPDLDVDFGINPYRGCEHGCAYCYARPTHEYLGFSAGLDFESRILVKENAEEMLRRELSRRSWKGSPIMMSGVTDPYQPVERRLRITRRCLAVLAESRNPVVIITKNHLVTRDIDLLKELAESNAVIVCVSVTTLDPALHRIMEPRTSTPTRRLEAIRMLANAGVPVHANVAPVVPAITEHEMPSILEAVAEAGAASASYILLRLPAMVAPLFSDWLRTHFPDRREKVLRRVKSLRRGKLNESAFGERMKGHGPYARQIRSLFHVARERAGLARPDLLQRLSSASFRPPAGGGQLDLF